MSETTGVKPCECRDCMEITYGGRLCHHCEDAGCVPWDGECLVEQWAEALEME
jgi:hypothetical protein